MLAVVFDLDGTLCDDGAGERAAFDAYARELAAESGTVLGAEALEAAFESRLRPALRGEIGLEEAAVAALRALDLPDVDERAGPRYRSRAAKLAAELATVVPGARETVARLVEVGIPLAVLANGWYAVARAKAAAVGFSGPVVVPKPGAWKPAPGAYEAVRDLFRLPFDRLWYVTAHRVDLDAARCVGMNGVWFDRAVESDAAQREGLADDVRISALAGLLPIVSAPYTQSALALRRLLLSEY